MRAAQSAAALCQQADKNTLANEALALMLQKNAT
jgi:hypothetical protein